MRGGRWERKGGREGDRAKRFRKRQTNRVWGHEWVERSRGGGGGGDGGLRT